MKLSKIYNVWNRGPDSHKYGGVKSVNGIPSSLMLGSPTTDNADKNTNNKKPV
jgi:hypothetical protein